MIEVEALQFTSTFKTYDDFRSEEKTTLLAKYTALLGVSTDEEFETIYKDTYDYVMQTIYNYYDCYYLTSATKDRFLTLLGTILSGKLPNYKVKYDNYLDARNQAYNTLGGRKTTSSGSGSGSSSGGQKFANTPEVINPAYDYVDQYSTSENKYNNSRSDKYSKDYEETLKASAKQIWENVKSIPDDIYKEVITITAKLFFSETMEEREYPCAYLTLTRRVQELGSSVITSLDNQINANYELVTTLVTEGSSFEATADLKSIVFKDLTTEYDEETHKVQTTWSFRNGMSGVDTYTIPMSSITKDGLMSASQFSKLDQVVLYGTNFASSGEKYAVRADEDLDLYVVVPKGEVAIASKDETGVVQLYANQLSIPVETTLYTSDLKVPVQMDSRNKLFVEVPNYILPEATTTAYGGIKLFNEAKGESVEVTTYTEGENIPVELDSSGKAFVKTGIYPVVKLYDKVGVYALPSTSERDTFRETIKYSVGTNLILPLNLLPEISTYVFNYDNNYPVFKVINAVTSNSKIYFGHTNPTTGTSGSLNMTLPDTTTIEVSSGKISVDFGSSSQIGGISISFFQTGSETSSSGYLYFDNVVIEYDENDLENSKVTIINPVIKSSTSSSATTYSAGSIKYFPYLGSSGSNYGTLLGNAYTNYTGYVVIDRKAYLL